MAWVTAALPPICLVLLLLTCQLMLRAVWNSARLSPLLLISPTALVTLQLLHCYTSCSVVGRAKATPVCQGRCPSLDRLLSCCVLCRALSGDGLTVASRRKYFQTASNRHMPFNTDYVWTFHLWQEYIDYASYMLNLGYSSYDLTQHLDGQPLQVGQGVGGVEWQGWGGVEWSGRVEGALVCGWGKGYLGRCRIWGPGGWVDGSVGRSVGRWAGVIRWTGVEEQIVVPGGGGEGCWTVCRLLDSMQHGVSRLCFCLLPLAKSTT